MALPTNEQEWDQQSGDGYQFDNNLNSGNIYTGITESTAEVKQVNQELATALLGYAAYMTTGYAYDVAANGSYNGDTMSHAGIDYQANAGHNVSVVVPGKIIKVEPDFNGIGQFVTVEGNDGKRWIYGHLTTFKNENDFVELGDSIGTIKDQGPNSHFHIEVHNRNANGLFTSYTGGIPSQNRDFVLENSISPLQAYWEWKNRGDTTPDQPTLGDSIINGTSDSNTLNGLGSNDKLYGHDGDDTMYGEVGNDYLDGGAGNDYLDAYASFSNEEYDTLTGGSGVDRFVLANASQEVFYKGDGDATITDYSPQDDYIQLIGKDTNYNLVNRGADTWIYLNDNSNDVIAIVQGGANLNMSLTQQGERMDFIFI